MTRKPYAFRRLSATLHGCSADLTSARLVEDAVRLAVGAAGMKLAHTFGDNPLVHIEVDDPMGGGVSAVALIVTSHLALHTAAKHKMAEFDVATCGDGDPEAALASIVSALMPERTKVDKRPDSSDSGEGKEISGDFRVSSILSYLEGACSGMPVRPADAAKFVRLSNGLLRLTLTLGSNFSPKHKVLIRAESERLFGKPLGIKIVGDTETENWIVRED